MSNPELLLLLALLFASAFFSATEAAFFSLNRVHLRRMERDGRGSSRRVLRALQKPSDVLITSLVGNNLANIGLSVLATGIFIRLLGPSGLEVSIAVTTVAVVVIGELTPKTLAVNFPEFFARLLVLPLRLMRLLLAPMIATVTWISHAFLRLLHLDAKPPSTGQVLSRGELGVLLEGADEEGLMSAQESRLVQNILQFSNTRAEEIMTPRIDMVATPLDRERRDLESELIRAKHSRIPVYTQTIDEVVGYIATRDFLLHPERKLTELLRPVAFFPTRALISQVFYEMQRRRTAVVIVVNEYGETVGLLTREDLLEELVGEIYDEFEAREDPLQFVEPGVFAARGTLHLEDLNAALTLDLPVEDALTLNGLLSGLHGGIPRKGDRIVYEGVEFTITEVSRHRIQRCLIRLPETTSAPGPDSIRAALEAGSSPEPLPADAVSIRKSANRTRPEREDGEEWT